MKGFLTEYIIDKLNAAVNYDNIPYHFGGAKLGIFILVATPVIFGVGFGYVVFYGGMFITHLIIGV